TTGYTIQVAVDEQSRELCFVSPDILFERMGVKP
ncbi:acyl-CoA thioesterase, partial [Escherichia coli]|nr:acyl-CoA thioesterase [Escherichia coli]